MGEEDEEGRDADDKEAQLKKEVFGMSAMFGIEALMKNFLNSDYLKEVHSNMKNKYAKTALAVLEGLGFVAGSIAGSTAGYKVGEIYVEKTQNNHKKNFTDEFKKLHEEINRLDNAVPDNTNEENIEFDTGIENKLLQKELLA